MVEYTPGQLATGGSPTPDVGLVGPSIDEPDGLAFDATGDLWVANSTADTVVEFTRSQLAAGGFPGPAVTVTSAGTSLDAPAGLAFDATGDLWVANFTSDTVVELTPTALTNGGPQPGAVTISSDPTTSLVGPLGLAFDATGDLWVTNSTASTVVELTRAQQLAGGSTPPSVTMWETGGIVTPDGLAFDATGDLWVANSTADTVVELTPTALAAGGTPVPKATLLEDATTSLEDPAGLAFDATGDLWVANSGNDTVVEFTARQLAAGGPQTAAVILISTSANSLDEPTDLAFDATGDLWVTNLAANTVVELSSSTLSTSGAPTPSVTLTTASTALDRPTQLALDSTGDLWVASATGDSVAEFSPTSLAAGGSHVPSSVIQGPKTGLDEPWGLAVFTPAATTTTVSVSPTSVGRGSSVTYSATVTSALATPTWTVGFSIGGTALCTATLSAGVASCAATDAPAGTATVTGTYSGDTTHAPSTGTAPLTVNAPPVTKGTTSSRAGYWLAGGDGGIFTFGNAPYFGSEAGQHVAAPVVAVASDRATGGYWEVAADGGIFSFGTAPFLGSMAGQALNVPIVGMAVTP